MIKLILPLIILTILGSGAAYALHLSGENERLSTELTQAVEVNQQNQQAIDRLTAYLKLKESQIKARNRARQQQSITIETLKRKLENEKSQLTVSERECMSAIVPVPVIEFLRVQTANRNRDTSSKNMPVSGILRANSHAQF